MSKSPSLLAVNASVPVKSLTEYLSFVKDKPVDFNFGTIGAGSAGHLAGALLSNKTRTPVTFVHYKGAGPLYVDLIAGQVQAAITTIPAMLPFIKSGKLLPVAVTSVTRSRLLPDVPTVAEQGISDYDVQGWIGIAVPAATPAGIVNKLAAEFARIARSPDVVRRLEDDGTVAIGSRPEQFRQFLTNEIAQSVKLAKEIGLKPEQ